MNDTLFNSDRRRLVKIIIFLFNNPGLGIINWDFLAKFSDQFPSIRYKAPFVPLVPKIHPNEVIFYHLLLH